MPPICRGHGKTKFGHRGCFQGGSTFQNYPSSPFWSDPHPCPAILRWAQRKYKGNSSNHPVPSNSYSLLGEEDLESGCTRQLRLRGQALAVQKLVRQELGLNPIVELPSIITCGRLREAVRSTYARDLTEICELSLKTAAKLETTTCSFCRVGFEKKLEDWKSKRFAPVDVDKEHLALFRKVFAQNVPYGWNRRKSPYIPNGHATYSSGRKDGGNWNDEVFRRSCRPEVVFSSGKQRIVTLYSSYNTRVLTPLHLSLYEHLRRKGWLLCGPPTEARVDTLQGHDWLSFDYEAATDNFKAAYVAEAISVLEEKSVGLSPDESRCLRVLSELRFEEDGPCAETGQPMGSVMSFPLLCLFNKTVVDMSLGRLLERGKISFNEFTGHQQIINGDDLLTREPVKGSYLFNAITTNGKAVGMKVNKEKTKKSVVEAEINSTLFDVEYGEALGIKKTNLGALLMAPDVSDVLGYAYESTNTKEGFRRVVRANARWLSRQERKNLGALPVRYRMLCRKDSKIRKAILTVPSSSRPCPPNLIPMVKEPEGFDLTIDEIVEVLHGHVEAIRPEAIRLAGLPKVVWRPDMVKTKATWSYLEKQKPEPERELIPRVSADYWKEKRMKQLVSEESCDYTPLCDARRPVGPDGSLMGLFWVLQSEISRWKSERKVQRKVGAFISPNWLPLDCG